MKQETDYLKPAPTKASDAGRSLLPVLLFAAGLAAFVLFAAFRALHLSRYDLRVPFNYSGDSLVILMYVKGLIQDGWPTTITHLSAPFGYPGAAFPILTSVDWLMMKFMSLFTMEPGHLANGFWLATLVFSAWSAAYAAYQLGLSKTFSFVSGALYALLPYAFFRNLAHLNLVYYPVPLLCLLAVIIVGGGAGVRNARRATFVGLLACVAQGFNYVYYSFFAVLLFGIAALLSPKRDGFRWLRLPILAIGAVAISTALNLLPGIQSWRQEGKPPEMTYKSPAEAEIYGTKIRRMLLPHPANPIRALAAFAQKDASAHFPNENENASARLGLYGAFGLMLMMLAVLRATAGDGGLQQPAAAISALGLATLLVITVGGFGAVINVLTVPDIRAYNRFSVFLSFFAIVTTGLWLSKKLAGLNGPWRTAGYGLSGAFIALSLYDQLLDAKPLVQVQQNDMRQAKEDRLLVEKMERIFSPGTAVLELPFTGFPLGAKLNNMDSYDLVRPYIWSKHLKWSWPSFSQRHRTWQGKMEALQGDDLMKAAIFSGFGAIWIDRHGYKDNGLALISSLTSRQAKQIDSGSGRIAILDIREAGADLKMSMNEADFRRQAAGLLDTVTPEWKDGFYDEERNAQGRSFRWARHKAEIVLRNYAGEPASLCAAFDMASLTKGRVRIEGAGMPMQIQTSTATVPVRLPLQLKPGETRLLRFSSSMPRFVVPGDPREMFFYVMDFDLGNNTGSGDHLDSCVTKRSIEKPVAGK